MKLDALSPVGTRDVHAFIESGAPESDPSTSPLRDLQSLQNLHSNQILHSLHPTSHSATTGGVKPSAKEASLAHAAAEMEAVFVRHLLEAAKLGGSSSSSGYGSMAVDALAAGIQKGGGIGLARAIEEAVGPHHPRVAPPAHPPPATPQTNSGTKHE